MPKAHRFFTPIGVMSSPEPPSDPQVGDTYFDTTLGALRSWDGTGWTAGGNEVEVGPTGPSDGTLELWVNTAAEPEAEVPAGMIYLPMLEDLRNRLSVLEERLVALEGKGRSDG